MLEQKDIELLKAAVGEVIDEKLEKKLDPINEELQDVNSKIGIVLDEIVRVHESLQEQIDNLEKNMTELRQYYRVDKLENDNMTLMLRLMNDLVKRVEELESKIA